MGVPPTCFGALHGGALGRRSLHAYCDHRAVGGHRAAASGGAFGGNEGGVAPGAAIGRDEHLVLAALHRAVGRVTVRTSHPNAERRARRTGIAFRARRARWAGIALRAWLALAATDKRS